MNAEYFNRIARVYGLGADEFLDLFTEQQHACAVCARALTLFSETAEEQPQVDHDHSTGKVRGILCRPCNIAIGWLEKNPERTVCALDYLVSDSRAGARPRGSDSWNSEQWKAWRKTMAGKTNKRLANMVRLFFKSAR